MVKSSLAILTVSCIYQSGTVRLAGGWLYLSLEFVWKRLPTSIAHRR